MGVSHTSSEFKDGARTGAHKVQGRCAWLGGRAAEGLAAGDTPGEAAWSPLARGSGPRHGPSAVPCAFHPPSVHSCPQGRGPHNTTGIQSPRVTPSGTGNPGGVRPRGRSQGRGQGGWGAGRPGPHCPAGHLHLRGCTHHGSAPPTVGVEEVVHLGVKDLPPGPQVPLPLGRAGWAWTEPQGLYRVEEGIPGEADSRARGRRGVGGVALHLCEAPGAPGGPAAGPGRLPSSTPAHQAPLSAGASLGPLCLVGGRRVTAAVGGPSEQL